jgi:hypothetical protein
MYRWCKKIHAVLHSSKKVVARSNPTIFSQSKTTVISSVNSTAEFYRSLARKGTYEISDFSRICKRIIKNNILKSISALKMAVYLKFNTVRILYTLYEFIDEYLAGSLTCHNLQPNPIRKKIHVLIPY